jgi:signal transduction histidine kinase
MGMIDLLQGTELAADQREYAEAVSQCSTDLLRIIDDLLDLSQIEAGRLSLADEEFDCRESLSSVVRMLRLRADGKHLYLTSEVEPEVPRSILGDSVRFRQVLINLVANAIKFTATGGIRVSLTMEGGTHLRCEVTDTGIGVAEPLRERIFEAFFQADGTNRRRYSGTGLGLAISRQLIETMGGQIGVADNRRGPGSTFWFVIPLRTSADSFRTAAVSN